MIDIVASPLQPHKLLALYHTMVMARAISRHLWLLSSKEAVLPIYGGPAPIGRGEVARRAGGAEAIQVAAAAALRPGIDWVVPHHRDLALRLALGVSPLDVMMALLGRAFDLGSRRARIATTSPITGAHMPHAAGIAYASKLLGRDEVTLVSIDGPGTDTGDWHEALNFAAVHLLPLVCLVQDDAPRATATPGQTATDLIVRRAHGYGMAAEGPTLVHARITALTSRTPRGSFQSQDQLEGVAHQDPIERMRRQLHESQLLDDDGDDQIQRDCIAVVEAALKQAQDTPMAEPAQALENVYGAPP